MGSTLEPDVRNEASNEIRDQYLDAARRGGCSAGRRRSRSTTGLRATVDWYTEVFRA